MSKVKIFPIPYAGASVNVYYSWKNILPDGYELCMTELAGRGRRFREMLYQSIAAAANDIANCMMKQLQPDEEYVIFGHSMGALLTYEVYYQLLQYNVQLPRHLFISGRIPPQILRKEESTEELDDKAFMKYVKSFGGIPKEFDSREIMEVFLPILRADFLMLDRYEYIPKKDKIHCDISILYGDKDFSIIPSEMKRWAELSDKNVVFYVFDGGHFYLYNSADKIIKLIVKKTGPSV